MINLNIPTTANFLISTSNEIPVKFNSIYNEYFKNELKRRLLENKSFSVSGLDLGSDKCGFDNIVSVKISANNKIKRTSFDSGSRFTEACEAIINELIN